MIEIVIVSAFITWGVNKTLQPGQIFGYLGDRIPDGKWFTKPLKSCIPCMSSVYGTIIFFSFYFLGIYAPGYLIFEYICFVFSLTGLNYFMICLIPE